MAEVGLLPGDSLRLEQRVHTLVPYVFHQCLRRYVQDILRHESHEAKNTCHMLLKMK